MPPSPREGPKRPKALKSNLGSEAESRRRVFSRSQGGGAEPQVERTGQRFRDFAELAVDIYWETDARLRFVYLSDAYEEFTGVAPQQIIGASYRQLVLSHAEDLKVVERHLAILEARLPYNDFEHTWCRQDGTKRILSASGKPFYDHNGVFRGYRCVARDVTVARYLTRRITYQATHDALTDLVNRHEFERRLERALVSAKCRGLAHSLCFLDLDQFKTVNDSAGHVAGDELLKRIAQLLNDQIRSRDTLARVGGDEFALLIENCPTEKAKDIADALLTTIREFRFEWKGLVFEIGASIGLVPITRENNSVRELLNTVDVACYTAKNLGRNRVHIYDGAEQEARPHRSQRLRAVGLRNTQL